MEKIYYIPTDKKIMCLTFDDGPNDPVTPIILDILKKFGIKATFFVLLENVNRHPHILKKVIQEGHAVEIHGCSHKSFRKHSKLTAYRYIKQCVETLQQQFGVSPKYLRPPYGTLTADLEIICDQFNLSSVGWTVMEKDWQPYASARKSECILKKCSPGKILVLHDGYRNFEHEGTTVENLKQVLPSLLAQGYRFVSVPELVASRSATRRIAINGIPLFRHEIINYECYKFTTLFFYWDINFINPTAKHACPTCGSEVDMQFLEAKAKCGSLNRTVAFKLPNPFFMEEWHKGIDFPLNSFPKTAEMCIKNREGFFVKI